MVQVLDGNHGEYIVIDCRFPYEYNGGHIKGAVNICQPDPMEKFFVNQQGHPESPISPQSPLAGLNERVRDMLLNDSKNICIIFHCEFSQHRAPKMYRYLRELDRKVHEDTYPQLYYPNIYVLEGGYRGFYEYLNSQTELCHDQRAKYCAPFGYIPMDTKDYQQELNINWKVMKDAWKQKKKRRGKSFLKR
jgi:rhodanese-related sulfurtransferase